ncbi:MAG: EAL domain-containing protein, partial [Coriobacteriales bacterium]
MDGIDNGHLTENKSENVADVNGNAGISDSVNSQDTVRQRVIESFGEYLGNPISLTRLKLRAQSTAGNSQLDATHSELSHLAENFRLVCDDACVLQEEDELVLTIPDNSTAILRKRLFHALDRDNGSLVWANVDRELQPIAGYAYGVPENDDDLWEMYIAAGENLSVASTENIKGSKYGDSPFDGSVPRKFIGKGRDQLTGLLTADEFRRRTEIFIKDEERSENLACVYFGFDNFSAYNEAYGYKAGDTLLRETAITISSVFPGSLISRISNTHMCVLCLQDKAAENANEVCNTINRHNVGSKSRIVLKAGIYIITSQSENIDSCCGKAKLAYYRNFNHYDKMFSIYDNKQNEENKERQYIIDNLERAIASQSIVTAYQPIIRSTTGEVHCLEVLARWNDPKKGIIPPNKFVQVCESAHIIHLLDAHVITMACRDWRSMVDAGYTPVGISINISRLDAQLCDIVEVIDRAVIENSIPRRLVHIEITETMLSDVTESLREAMDELRNKGYSLWMDDYGSGYSSLETLANYKFDLVKLDKSLLKQATDTSRSGIVLSSTIDMAKQLGMHTLCEGVETEQHAKLLREIGCEFQQGFLYSRPLYLDELKEKIDSGELVIEDPMWEGYSNAASNVNVLSTNPFSNSGKLDHGSKITMQDPLAIIERIPGEGLRFLVKDPAFEQMAKDEGFASPEEALRTIIADQPYTAERFQAMLDP